MSTTETGWINGRIVRRGDPVTDPFKYNPGALRHPRKGSNVLDRQSIFGLPPLSLALESEEARKAFFG